jgi:hypothetical protein
VNGKSKAWPNAPHERQTTIQSTHLRLKLLPPEQSDYNNAILLESTEIQGGNTTAMMAMVGLEKLLGDGQRREKGHCGRQVGFPETGPNGVVGRRHDAGRQVNGTPAAFAYNGA